jgi:DNA repair protein SbcC/Rad50
VATAPGLERRYAAELETLRAERAAAEGELDEAKSAWLRDKQDAKTKLEAFRDRGKELKDQIRELEKLGPDGPCPICGRPVGDGYEALLEQLRESWQEIVQDGKWWKSRAEQLEPKPEGVAERETRVRALAEQVDDRAAKHTRCQSAVQELEQRTAEMAEREARRTRLGEELEALPAGYDAAVHRAAEARLAELRELEKRAARLEETAARRPAQEQAAAEAAAREAAAGERAGAASAERGALDFSEEAFQALRAEHERIDAALRAAELHAADVSGALKTAEEGMQAADRARAQYEERIRAVEGQETELRYHDELDAAYSELRQELNDQVRPELSEIASAFLGAAHRRPLHLDGDRRGVQPDGAGRGGGEAGHLRRRGGHRQPGAAPLALADDRRARRAPALAAGAGRDLRLAGRGAARQRGAAPPPPGGPLRAGGAHHPHRGLDQVITVRLDEASGASHVERVAGGRALASAGDDIEDDAFAQAGD